jgi:hypothetical protein
LKTLNLVACSFVVIFLLVGSASIQSSSFRNVQTQSAQTQKPLLPFIQSKIYSEDSARFAFISNFEDMALDGWSSVKGTTPTVVTTPNYSGEPALSSNARTKPQIDYATSNFVGGQVAISFQVAIYAPSGTSGYFGVGSSDKKFVAVVGVNNSEVYAGKDIKDLKKIEAVPTGTAYPTGWVYIIADITQGVNGKWTMEVFIDATAQIAMTVSVPSAGSYAGALIETDQGTVDYTNIIVSTYQIANLVNGYNNMQGYGQRVSSAGIVQLLPPYQNYTAIMTLNSWTIPQSGILSFQINSLNTTASETPGGTCVGFFQLGMDIDKAGQIDPWYVPGVDCEAASFTGDFSTPKGSVIILSILFLSKSHQIEFKEVDTSISKTMEATISYSGDAFVGAYTQMEFQPCCNNYPITDYGLHGSLTDMQITPVGGSPESLNSTYMIPFNLDTPTTWSLNYYQNSAAGYVENNTG